MAKKVVTLNGLAYAIDKLKEMINNISVEGGGGAVDASSIISGRFIMDRLPTSSVANRVLRVDAANSSPVYSQVKLTTDVTGILSILNGGTGVNNFTSGSVLVGNGTGPIQTREISSVIGDGSSNKLVTEAAIITYINQVGGGGGTTDAGGITSGILAIARGGTGAGTKSGALASLGAAAVNHTHLAVDLPDLAPSVHNHSALNITSGTLPVSRGGTGLSSIPINTIPVGNGTGAFTPRSIVTTIGVDGLSTSFATEGAIALALSTKSNATHTHKPEDLTSGILPINRGGTGGNTPSTARAALFAAADSHTHDINDLTKPTTHANGNFYTGTTSPTGTTRLNYGGYFYATEVWGGVWNNDYAENRRSIHDVIPGQVLVEDGDDILRLSTERLEASAMIVSDTHGFSMGHCGDGYYPVAVAGRVLAYPYEDRHQFNIGDPVCSGPNGSVSIMTRDEVKEYPDRIIGTVSSIPSYDIWENKVKVNGRIWIRVR